MRSSNPILSRRDAFTPAQPQNYQQGPYGQPQQGFPQYGQAPYGQNPYGQPGNLQDPRQQAPLEGRMTLDDVLTKTGISLAVLVLAAVATFLLLPPALITPAVIASGLVTFVTSLFVAFRRTVNPALVLFYAGIEGIFVGGFSMWFEYLYPGIVVQAVFATLVAAGTVLAAYKFFNFRASPKFRQIVSMATIAFAFAMLVNFGLSLAGVNTGLRDGGTGPVSLLAIGVSLFAVVLAVLNLVLDFDYIEEGIAMGAPASESWKAAFGLMVTLVWLYIEMLRMISYLRRD